MRFATLSLFALAAIQAGAAPVPTSVASTSARPSSIAPASTTLFVQPEHGCGTMGGHCRRGSASIAPAPTSMIPQPEHGCGTMGGRCRRADQAQPDTGALRVQACGGLGGRCARAVTSASISAVTSTATRVLAQPQHGCGGLGGRCRKSVIPDAEPTPVAHSS